MFQTHPPTHRVAAQIRAVVLAPTPAFAPQVAASVVAR
jgi:hypothetical protein